MLRTLLLTAGLLTSLVGWAETLSGQVVRVKDGDTIVVLTADHRQEDVRLMGIDAPEKRQAFGQRAKEQLSDMVFGHQVEIEWRKRDRDHRIIGQVFVDGVDANLELVTTGLAWHYARFQREQLIADRGRYAEAELLARAERRGLWADESPIPPWDFRPKRTKRKAPL